MVDFAALLNKRTEDAVRPPPLPAGDFLLQVTKYSFDESRTRRKLRIASSTSGSWLLAVTSIRPGSRVST